MWGGSYDVVALPLVEGAVHLQADRRGDSVENETEMIEQALADAACTSEGAAVAALPDGLFAMGEGELLEADADELLQAEVVYTSDKEL
eukprot:tig00000057_g28.t1